MRNKFILFILGIIALFIHVICKENECRKDEDCGDLCPLKINERCIAKCEKGGCLTNRVLKAPARIEGQEKTSLVEKADECKKDEDCHDFCPQHLNGRCNFKCERKGCTVQMVPRGPYIIIEKDKRCVINADCKCPKNITESCKAICSKEKCILEVIPRAPVLVMDENNKCSKDGDCECPIGEAVGQCKPLCAGNICSFSLNISQGKKPSDYNDEDQDEEDTTCEEDRDCQHLCPKVFEGKCVPHCREKSCNLGLIPPPDLPINLIKPNPKEKRSKRYKKCKKAGCANKRSQKRKLCKTKKCQKFWTKTRKN